MEKNILDILNKWSEFTGFDVNNPQTTFSLNGYSYEINDGNKNLATIINDYDNTGNIAVLYIKALFDYLLLNVDLNAYKIFNNIDNKGIEFDKIRDVFNMLNSNDILKIQQTFINKINNFVNLITNKKQIGVRNEKEDLNILIDSLEFVIKGLKKCNYDLHLKGGIFLPITNIGKNINVFNSLADCLLNIEQQIDGAYICYINLQGMEGYFAIVIKNNGNILSVNERINENYRGEHFKRRTDRWANEKQYNLFPYNEVIDFVEKGYKGKDNIFSLKEDNLSIFDLSVKSYLPLLLGLLLLNNKYQNNNIDIPLVYVDSLMKYNVEKQIQDGTMEIAIINKSAVATINKEYSINFETEKILNGSYDCEFNYNTIYDKVGSKEYYDKQLYKCTGAFNNLNQYMVDLWGDGFSVDINKLFETQKLLIEDNNDNKKETVVLPEYVGNDNRMKLLAYYEVRKELANYIKNKIKIEYEKFGGIEKVKEWYEEKIRLNINNIYKLIYDNYIKNNYHKEFANYLTENDYDISIAETNYVYSNIKLNNKSDNSWNYYYICPINNKKCNMFVKISPKNWKGIQILVNTDLPKIVKGYERNRHHDGNSNIDATDLVSQVGTPFESWGSFTLSTKDTYNFEVAIGFSKSGFNKFIKNKGMIDNIL